MPMISNVKLSFTNEEKKSRTDITSNDPMTAPTSTAKNPENERLPIPTDPPNISITTPTPKLAPELMPSMDGSAK
jgi:hypothetical protein